MMRLRNYLIIGLVCILLLIAWMVTSAFAIDTVVYLKHKNTSVPCLIPSEILQEEIEVIKHAMPRDFPMGGRLHCLDYGIIRAYLVEYWDNHMQHLEIVALEYPSRGQGSKFWVHLWRPELGFMLLRPITYDEWKGIVSYFTWGDGSK